MAPPCCLPRRRLATFAGPPPPPRSPLLWPQPPPVFNPDARPGHLRLLPLHGQHTQELHPPCCLAGLITPLVAAKTRQPGKPKDAFADFAKYIYGRTGRLQNVYDYVGLKVPFGCAKFVYTVTRQVPLPRLRDRQERVPRRPAKYPFGSPSSSTTCTTTVDPRRPRGPRTSTGHEQLLPLRDVPLPSPRSRVPLPSP